MLRILPVLSCACVGAIVLIAPARSAEPALRWERSLDAAKRIAAAEHKDLFINFTGREWCGNCTSLEQRFLSQPEFAQAEKHFVLVDLDYPSDRDDLRELKDSYEKWAKDYLIHGYPTVVLAAADGRPFAFFTGCDSKIDIAAYLDQLRAAQARKKKSDAQFLEADKLTGADRARKLHAALETIADGMEGLSARHEDPLLVFYAKAVAEIRQLDANNALKLRELYDARATARDAFHQQESILEQVYKYETKEECPAALALIDKLLGEITNESTRFRLQRLRVGYLETNEQYEDALKLVRELQTSPLCPAEDRPRLFRDETNYLQELKRLDEAIRCCDQRAAAAKTSKDRFEFLKRKVEVLLQANDADHRAETITASLAAQAAAKPQSDEWADATSNLGWAYRYAGRYREALATFQKSDHYWSPEGADAEGLMFTAELQHELGQDDEARKSLDQAEKILPKTPSRLIRQYDIELQQQELKRVRELVGPASNK